VQVDRAMGDDPYFKKTVTLRAGERRLTLAVSQELFSSHQVDRGTRQLLRSVQSRLTQAPAAVLDLGCGYGALGLGSKALYPAAEVHMVDRDALAVHYAGLNAERNGFADLQTYGSLAYDRLRRRRFDLVVSNLPGKAPERFFRHVLENGCRHLEPGGLLAIVVVSPLAEQIRAFAEATPCLELELDETAREHVVLHLRGTGAPSPDGADSLSSGVYDRGRMALRLDGRQVDVGTVYGLPEFDTLAYDTELVKELVEEAGTGAGGRLLAVRPGQGHRAVLAAHRLSAGSVTLVDRDLLALEVTRGNLAGTGVVAVDRIDVRHQWWPLREEVRDRYQMVVARLDQKDPSAVARRLVTSACQVLSEEGTAVLHGTSTAVSRSEAWVGAQGPEVRVLSRLQLHGYAALALRRTRRG
jgi:16S rRNA (guanine1207-N2)-methyltransferase